MWLLPTGTETSQPLRVVFFLSPNCSGCAHLNRRVLPAVSKRFGDRIVIEKRDVRDIDVYKELLVCEEHYESDENEVLKVFVGVQYLAGPKSISAGLAKTVEAEIAKGSVTFSPSVRTGDMAPAISCGSDAGPGVIERRFYSFDSIVVAGAGLVDGVNPCAFTTMVFLVSLLAYLGRSRSEILLVGMGFSVSVFATYLLLGLGAFGSIKAMAVGSGISRGLTWAAVVLVFVLAGLSLMDHVRYRGGVSGKGFSLRLPRSIHERVHRVIRSGVSGRRVLVGSMSAGCVVALLESLCTGQVYLPTIIFMLNNAETRTRAVSYLVLYNVTFIIPLLVIFVLAYWGVDSRALGGFLRRHLGAFRIAMGLTFCALGVALLRTLL